MLQPNVMLYGSAGCHKTIYYQEYLSERGVDYTFKDVLKEEENATELRGLYASGKLNFPTLMVHGKKLRNPSDKELNKWLEK